MDDEWHIWIDRLKSKDLTEEELREFERMVKESPSRRDEYLSSLLSEVALEAGGLSSPLATPMVARKTSRFVPKIAAVAAGIAALATAGYFFGTRASAPPHFSATITDVDDPSETIGLRIGQPLENGPVSVPENAMIGVAMRGGARLEIRGPANLTIQGPDKIRLEKGRLSTYAPPYAHGFVIDTVDGRIIDLGTRFVTAVGADSGTEIHVLEGLVEALAAENSTISYSLKDQDAAILREGKLESTEFLAQRLAIPLDPLLPDQDADGFPDVVEEHYGSLVDDATSQPAPLRIEESFTGYSAGSMRNVPLRAKGAVPGGVWEGAGFFEEEGLTFEWAGKALRTSGGAVRTTGETGVGMILRPAPEELPPVGVTYVSFIMRNPAGYLPNCFAGLLFYQGDREEFFIGKLSVENSYGSRLKQADVQDPFGIEMDDRARLFVVRIDRTRLVTDVFIDPIPGDPEASVTRHFRYQDVPNFDRIAVRSGSRTEAFPSTFDEIRVGLTWESVLPLQD